MNIAFNGNQFAVSKTLSEKPEYTDYICKTATGIKVVLRQWADGLVEHKKRIRCR